MSTWSTCVLRPRSPLPPGRRAAARRDEEDPPNGETWNGKQATATVILDVVSAEAAAAPGSTSSRAESA